LPTTLLILLDWYSHYHLCIRKSAVTHSTYHSHGWLLLYGTSSTLLIISEVQTKVNYL